MIFQEYLTYFKQIIEAPAPPAPYDNPDYSNYTLLNWTRLNRWLKTGILTESIGSTVAAIQSPQQWIVITEPWCGDAAHIVPFLEKIAALNPLIQVDYELRDAEPFRINQYLTNGTKSIPRLIIRNAQGEDLAVWGPRPAKCQEVYQKLTSEKADFETVKNELQKWYNKDKGVEIQREIEELLAGI
ncbi:thioredoxin family protein [Arcticibacter sp. MXS-1]|uniref:thioredoxin family protein n=1 Tax=Arcticibacter sp. MXS-1 TaxID=3341726 RepID=UPI0035A82CEA